MQLIRMSNYTFRFKYVMLLTYAPLILLLSDKDVIRTDRKHSFYKEDPSNPNMRKLYDILMTYCMYNFDLGE